VIDDMDKGIIHALQLDPRAAFQKIAAVLGISEQTVARRYRRLRGDGLLRVIGMVDPRHVGQPEWMVRVGCRPGGTGPLAEALARRDDVSWVTLSAGGSEVTCSVRSRSARQRDDLLIQRLPATSQVLSMTAHAVLHRFLGGSATDWTGYGSTLTAQQIAALTPERGVAHEAEAVALTPEDQPLLGELANDGRASYATLAAAAGISQGRATRRVAALHQAGLLYFDVDLAAEPLGFATAALLWLTVAPASLAAVGSQIADHPEVPFAAAVSGSANLVASVICRDTEALYQYVTTRISAAEGVRQLEISPVLRRVKQAGTWVEGQRLAAGPRASRGTPARRPVSP
jgi:DNA-binding Lrp family transcriptional regulator